MINVDVENTEKDSLQSASLQVKSRTEVQTQNNKKESNSKAGIGLFQSMIESKS